MNETTLKNKGHIEGDNKGQYIMRKEFEKAMNKLKIKNGPGLDERW